MHAVLSALSATQPLEARLEQIIEAATAQLEAGRPVDVDALAAAHPEFAEQLRTLLPMVATLVGMGGALTDPSADLAPANGHASTPPYRQLGDFRILRELGRGGMGAVYEAEQLTMGRRVALKVLPFAALADERSLQRFRNEVRAAAALDHPNIVSVYSVGEERGVHFYAMHLIRGQTLAELISQLRNERIGSPRVPLALPVPDVADHSKSLPPPPPPSTKVDEQARISTAADTRQTSAAHFRRAAQLGVQAAEALQHAHDQGVLHRDVKPGNLLLDAAGKLYVTDFGLARIEADAGMTMTGDIVGTLRYMAPEQALAKRVVIDHRADVYSLGATLYELLTLQPAFGETDRSELIKQIAFEDPKPLRKLDARIPAELETIVLKAMAKNPDERYLNAERLAEDLTRYLENRPIAARRPSLTERCRKWTARHAALMVVAAISLAVVAAIGATAALLTHRAYRAETQQRVAAEANLDLASRTIDGLLSRVAKDRYWHGQLAEAEKLAADATVLYEELLKRSNDPLLQFRAALAYGDVAGIWLLVGRHEKSGIANRRAGALLLNLISNDPNRPDYLVALAANYNHMGLVDWALNRPIEAEPSFRQAWEVCAELAERFPEEPAYRQSIANMLSNLGSVCYFSNRYDAAEEYYRQAKAISDQLPAEMQQSAEGLASEAGSLSTSAELARLRGQYDVALQLLEAALPFHRQSLEKWPSNPVALDCYAHTYWNIAECHIGAGRPVEAAAAVERLVKTFPDRLAAYHEGAEQLLRCAAIAEHGDDARQVKTDQKSLGSGASNAYRHRAYELVAKAPQLSNRTPDAVDRFARFLLTCEDRSIRDAPLAMKLAKEVINDVPEHAWPWFTLALANYRNGDLREAEKALQKSIKLSPDGQANGYDWLLLAMIRWQQDRRVESRQLLDKANEWIDAIDASFNTDVLINLSAEADALIRAGVDNPHDSSASAN